VVAVRGDHFRAQLHLHVRFSAKLLNQVASGVIQSYVIWLRARNWRNAPQAASQR